MPGLRTWRRCMLPRRQTTHAGTLAQAQPNSVRNQLRACNKHTCRVRPGQCQTLPSAASYRLVFARPARAAAAHPPQRPQSPSCMATTEPQPPKRSFAQPKRTTGKRSSDSAPAHMMHGSHVTYSAHLRTRARAALAAASFAELVPLKGPARRHELCAVPASVGAEAGRRQGALGERGRLEAVAAGRQPRVDGLQLGVARGLRRARALSTAQRPPPAVRGEASSSASAHVARAVRAVAAARHDLVAAHDDAPARARVSAHPGGPPGDPAACAVTQLCTAGNTAARRRAAQLCSSRSAASAPMSSCSQAVVRGPAARSAAHPIGTSPSARASSACAPVLQESSLLPMYLLVAVSP